MISSQLAMTLRDFLITMMQKQNKPFDDPIELGNCDTCDATYELSDKDGRCGDCGECQLHCSHLKEWIVSLDYHFYITASSAQKAFDFAYYMVAPPTFEGQTAEDFCGSEIAVYDSDTMEWVEIDTPSE